MSMYDHFRKEERPFVDQVLEWKELVKGRFVHKLTDFLDPREQQIITTIIGQDQEVRFSFFGGTEETERKRAFLFPPFLEPTVLDYQLSAYKVHYPQKFIQLTHPDLLGAMMALGLKRDKFGDIYIQEEVIHIVIASEISSYVEANLQNVGRAQIRLEAISLEKLMTEKEEWFEKFITASSLRLDVILSEIYQLSRSKIVPLIEAKKVKVNWKIIEQPSFQVQTGDYLSVRGLGRSKLIDVLGKTKKDKWRIEIGLRK
uniref:RNA-binding protein n=2 Tax=Anaerobacillus isosaccharinicus TaxID=1532552 RepID=A0A1S2M794_9BACI|nr:RNA-binding protein [Anaerobacillus isosaccharinicus]MBA5587421.1 RNA-binding protein [Anaerobacillus isosaccharinicus]QOY34390.1 RNA-binding protein [Anaerobacillus isosaccharinicus]